MTETELGPAENVTVALPELPADSVMLEGDTDPELLESCTVPANPLTLVTVTENLQFPLSEIQFIPGGAVTLKSVTLTETVVEWENTPLLPVTVTV